MSRFNNKHRRAIEHIASNPHIIGFENMIFSAVEVRLFGSNGRLVACPDIVLIDKRWNYYTVEYKSNGDDRLRRKAEHQLYQAVKWFSDHGITPKTRIIDGSKYPNLKEQKTEIEGYDGHTIKRNPRRDYRK